MTLNPDGSYTSNEFLFRSLTAAEVEEFRVYARENDPPMRPTIAGGGPDTDRLSILHPVCRDEWARLGKIPAELG